MVKRRRLKVLLCLLAILILSCWCLPGGCDDDPELPPGTATYTTIPTPTNTISHILEAIEIDPCTYFEKKEMTFMLHELIKGESSLTMYVKIPGGIPYYEFDVSGQMEWVYYATLGKLESTACKTFEGEVYEERLYCFFYVKKEYYNTVQPFKLYVNLCDDPIYEVPNLSVMAVAATKEPGDPCGPEPTACGPAHENWCLCVGALFSGCVEGTPVCFYP